MQEMNKFRLRLYLVLGGTAMVAAALILLALSNGVGFVDYLSERMWIAWVLVVLSLLTTGFLWYRLRDRPGFRPWLIRKVAGNVVLIAGIVIAKLLDAPFEVMLGVVFLAMIIWALALGKIVVEYRKQEGKL